MKKFKTNALLLLFFASAAVLLLVALAMGLGMRSSVNALEESTRRQMLALSEAASHMVDAEDLDRFLSPPDMHTPEYLLLKKRLDEFNRHAELEFTYYMRLDVETDKMQFIIDNVLDPLDEPDGLDSPQVDRELGTDLALAGKPYVQELGSYSVGWDGLMSAWAPVYYRDGTRSNMVAGVDLHDITLLNAYRTVYVLMTVLAVSMVAVFGICALCLRLYRRKARMAEIASEVKSSFLSRMSHEIRTPMNAIIGLSRMASQSDDLTLIREYLGNIGVSAQHLRNIVDDVLDIAKIESGRMILEQVPVCLKQDLEQLEKIVRPQAEARGQTYQVLAQPGLPEFLRYDKTHVRQVLLNLLSNAVKFTPEGGKISLSVSCLQRDETRCRLEWRVKDNGIGIAPENRDHLFTAFEQADGSNTRRYGGAGLGLTISRQLVEMMGGKIRLESAPGQGSEFSFSLWVEVLDKMPGDNKNTAAAAPSATAPRRPDSPAGVAPEAAVAESAAASEDENGQTAQNLPDLRGKHVLLVEDAAINSLVAASLLEEHGAEVDVAENGQAGLEAYLAGNGKYDLVFMDIQMPVMDGYEATRRIRASGRNDAASLPIIAMTANVFKEDVEKAFAAGMNGHVGKPLDLTQLRETLLRVLRAA